MKKLEKMRKQIKNPPLYGTMKRILTRRIIFLLIFHLFLIGCSADSSLLDAAGKSSLDGVKRALERGANVNSVNPQGATALMLAVEKPEIIKMLMAAGAAIDREDKEKKTALLIAAEKNSLETVQLLLKAKAKIIHEDEYGNNVLILGAGNAAIVSFILDSELLQIDKTGREGKSALLRAAEHGNAESIKLLLAAGADLHLRDSDGNTALILAVKEQKVASVKALLAAGSKVNHQNERHQTAFDLVEDSTSLEQSKNAEAIKRLLEKRGGKKGIVYTTDYFDKKVREDQLGTLKLGSGVLLTAVNGKHFGGNLLDRDTGMMVNDYGINVGQTVKTLSLRAGRYVLKFKFSKESSFPKTHFKSSEEITKAVVVKPQRQVYLCAGIDDEKKTWSPYTTYEESGCDK